jgi:hypothetical protein
MVGCERLPIGPLDLEDERKRIRESFRLPEPAMGRILGDRGDQQLSRMTD